jgi:hypothetical protein
MRSLERAPVAAMPLSPGTIEQILQTASPHIRRDATGTSFTILCTVEEGRGCRFATSDWADESLAGLAQNVIDELGWKAVERSFRRQSIIRCVMPGADASTAKCEIDRGAGFEPMTQEASPAEADARS